MERQHSINLSGYCTQYVAIVNKKIQYSTSGDICFGRYNSRIPLVGNPIETKYIIYLHTSDYYLTKLNHRNYCVLDIKDMKSILDEISTNYYPFTYEFTKVTNNSMDQCVLARKDDGKQSDKVIKLEITISGTRKQHLWVLCLIRHFYEPVQEFFLIEALRIRKQSTIESLRNENLINLLQIVATSSPLAIYSTDQSFGCKNRKLISVDEIRKLILKGEDISKFYTITGGNYKNEKWLNKIPQSYTVIDPDTKEKFDMRYSKDLEYWTLDIPEEFAKREQVYVNVQQLLSTNN